MFESFKHRLLLYLLIWLASGLAWLVAAVLAAMADSDPSAGAWIGFLPFIFPIFWLEPAYYLAPLAALVEVVIAFRRQLRHDRSEDEL